MKAYVPVRGMVKLESFIDTEGVYYPAAEVDAEIARLKDENGEQDSLYQDRLLDMEGRHNTYRRKVAALVEAAKEVPKRYKLYRARGAIPAPEQYQEMVSAIARLEAALAALETMEGK
jgi:hypothetical protein